MLLESDKSLEECKGEISDAIRSTQLYGRVVDRAGRCGFCITNRSHYRWRGTREPGRLLPISVYCRGSIVPAGSGVIIRAKFVYGFRLIELMVYALLLFLILLYRRNSSYGGESLCVVFLMTLGGVAFVYLLSVILSACSLLGGDDKDELMYFFTSNLQADFRR